METSRNSGMTRSSLVESVMVMVLMMVVKVWRKDNDGLNFYAHGYPFTVMMVIVDNLYNGSSGNERSTVTK